jgi:beta-galactosidase
MPYQTRPATEPDLSALPKLTLSNSSSEYIVKGADFTVCFGKKNGALSSLEYKGKQFIASPLVPNFWRAPTQNDKFGPTAWVSRPWMIAGPKRLVTSVKARQIGPHTVQVTSRALILFGMAVSNNVYTVRADREIEIECSLRPLMSLPDLPRFGMTMSIPGEYLNIKWYGRGPHETYWDRKTGAAVGLYEGEVDRLIHRYVVPQENGNHTDVRWVEFTDAEGSGLMASGSPLLSVSAWPYTMADLQKARHTHELSFSREITVNLDYKQMGVGGESPGMSPPHPEYRLPAKPYSYKFSLRPLP